MMSNKSVLNNNPKNYQLNLNFKECDFIYSL